MRARYVTKDKPLISEVSLAPDLRSLAGTSTWKFESLKHAISDSQPLSDTARIGSLAVSDANDLRSMRLNAGGEEQLYEFGKAAQAVGIVGDHPDLLKILEKASLLAPTKFPVLILGETGTGKELLARFVHHLSKRPIDRFIPLNCAAIPKDLVESTLPAPVCRSLERCSPSHCKRPLRARFFPNAKSHGVPPSGS